MQKLREMKNQFLGLETVTDRQTAWVSGADDVPSLDNSNGPTTGPPKVHMSSRAKDEGSLAADLADRKDKEAGAPGISGYFADSTRRLYRSQSHEPESGPPPAVHQARKTSPDRGGESGAVNTLFLSKTKTGTYLHVISTCQL